MPLTALAASSASAWRAALPGLHGRIVSDELVDAVDSHAAPVRSAIINKLDRALAAGVCDSTTLDVIAEVVARVPAAAA